MKSSRGIGTRMGLIVPPRKYWRYSRCLWGLRRRTIRRRNDRGFIYAPGLSAARDRLSLDRAFLGPVGGAGLRHQQIGRAHVRTPVTNAHLVCRLLLEKKKNTNHSKQY